jgi:hypothetical protein
MRIKTLLTSLTLMLVAVGSTAYVDLARLLIGPDCG